MDLSAQPWLSPAKINLFLHITGQREDGYHLLQSIIQFIDLYDRLQFTLRDDGKIRCDNSMHAILPQHDLSVRAAKLLQTTCSIARGVTITLHKVIPAGAGLGGGSSNAATTFLALNQLWNCGLEQYELEDLGRQLGADIPVFIRGEASWVEGVGDHLQPVSIPEAWMAVVFPNVHLDTRKMFAAPDLTRNCAPIRIRDFTQQRTRNVFEHIASREYPEIARAFQWLSQFSPARLTGSGSGLFAICQSRQQARDIAARCPQPWQAYAVKGLNHSPVCSR